MPAIVSSNKAQDINTALVAARRARQKHDFSTTHLLDSVADGYAVQALRLAAMDTHLAGYKLGGTNEATRRAFDCTEPYHGALGNQEVTRETALHWPEAIAPVVEPELAVWFSRDLPARPGGYEPDELQGVLAGIAPALEFPDTVLPDAVVAGLPWLLADGCAAGRLVLGRALPSRMLDSLWQAPCILQADGNSRSTASAAAVLGNPYVLLSNWTQVLGRLGLDLAAHLPVATGGIVPAIPVAGHKTITVSFAGTTGLSVDCTGIAI